MIAKGEEPTDQYKIRKKPFSATIYPHVFFAYDDYANLLQVVDLVTAAVSRPLREIIHNNRNCKELKRNIEQIENLANCNPYLREYWDLFIRDPRHGKVFGWGIKVWYG